jgi:prophage DNA circulation protein
MADEDIFSQYPVARWQVGSAAPICFPALGITETGGNRIIAHERPFRDGAKLDDTGAKPRSWSFCAHFSNRIEEPGCEENPLPLYPGMLRLLIESFDQHETGDLTLPTVGTVRCRAQDYTRKEDPENTDVGLLDLVFVQDNEDALDRALLNPPTVRATITKLAEQATGSLQRDGVWGEDLRPNEHEVQVDDPSHSATSSLTEIAADIEGLLLAPGRATADLESTVRAHRRAVQRVMTAASGDDSRRGGEAERLLSIMLDREAAAADERTASRPRTRAFVIDVERTSIYEVSARLHQDAEELLDLNAARIDDPFRLDRGQVIRVYESAPR